MYNNQVVEKSKEFKIIVKIYQNNSDSIYN